MINHIIKNLARKYLNLKIFRILPHGISELEDISRAFPGYSLKMIFDVGSNVGQSVNKFRSAIPEVVVHCFEPVDSTFQVLSSKVISDNVVLNKLALGAKRETIQISVPLNNLNSDLNSIIHGNVKTQSNNLKTEVINVNTLDEYCSSKEISRIDYLKIDTEGYDLEVLKGAKSMLAAHKIDFIEIESGMNPENKYHVPFEELKQYLEQCDYRLFGIYEQQSEWKPIFPMLRRVNALFLSKKLFLNSI